MKLKRFKLNWTFTLNLAIVNWNAFVFTQFRIVTVILLLLLSSCRIHSAEKIPIGAIFEQGTTQIQSAFKYALMMHQNEEKRFEVQAFVDEINSTDTFKLSRLRASGHQQESISLNHLVDLALHSLEIGAVNVYLLKLVLQEVLKIVRNGREVLLRLDGQEISHVQNFENYIYTGVGIQTTPPAGVFQISQQIQQPTTILIPGQTLETGRNSQAYQLGPTTQLQPPIQALPQILQCQPGQLGQPLFNIQQRQIQPQQAVVQQGGYPQQAVVQQGGYPQQWLFQQTPVKDHPQRGPFQSGTTQLQHCQPGQFHTAGPQLQQWQPGAFLSAAPQLPLCQPGSFQTAAPKPKPRRIAPPPYTAVEFSQCRRYTAEERKPFEGFCYKAPARPRKMYKPQPVQPPAPQPQPQQSVQSIEPAPRVSLQPKPPPSVQSLPPEPRVSLPQEPRISLPGEPSYQSTQTEPRLSLEPEPSVPSTAPEQRLSLQPEPEFPEPSFQSVEPEPRLSLEPEPELPEPSFQSVEPEPRLSLEPVPQPSVQSIVSEQRLSLQSEPEPSFQSVEPEPRLSLEPEPQPSVQPIQPERQESVQSLPPQPEKSLYSLPPEPSIELIQPEPQEPEEVQPITPTEPEPQDQPVIYVQPEQPQYIAPQDDCIEPIFADPNNCCLLTNDTVPYIGNGAMSCDPDLQAKVTRLERQLEALCALPTSVPAAKRGSRTSASSSKVKNPYCKPTPAVIPSSCRKPSAPKPKPRLSCPPPEGTVECCQCGRYFTADRIDTHEEICMRSAANKCNVFNQTTMGTEAGPCLASGCVQNPPACSITNCTSASRKKCDFRKKHEDFIRRLRTSKTCQYHSSCGNPNVPPLCDNADYAKCPHCCRKISVSAIVATPMYLPNCQTFKFKPNKRQC